MEGIPIIDYEVQTETNLYVDSSTVFNINGPNQERSLSWTKCIASHSFRNELVEFLMNYWRDNESIISEILQNKRVSITLGPKCFMFSNDPEFNKKKEVISLQNNHPNFNFKTILHISKTCSDCKITIKTRKVDFLLVLLLFHMKFMAETKQIYIDTSISNNKAPEVINVRKIFTSLDTTIIDALPAWYIFTGCAYEPPIFGKTKKKAYQLLIKELSTQKAFGKLGTRMHQPNEIYEVIEEFTCKLNSSKAVAKKVDAARVQMFRKAFDSKKGNIFFIL